MSQNQNVRKREHDKFSDGGLDGVNNPTLEAYQEINGIHGTKNGAKISIVVNIGTAKAVTKPFGSTVIGTAKKGVAQATKVENVVENMREKAKSVSGLKYFRFNATEKGCDVQLDDWKPSRSRAKFTNKIPGQDTLAAIDRCFDEWYSDPIARNPTKNGKQMRTNKQLLEDCAERLVKIRRDRVKQRSRWERYATGAHYYCDVRNCEAEFQYRHLFNRHLNDHYDNELEDEGEDIDDPWGLDDEVESDSDGALGLSISKEFEEKKRKRRVHLNECRKRWEYPAKLGADEGRYS